MIVMKFGGTSVGTAANLRRVTEIVRAHTRQRPIVVVSAMNGITDLILSATQAAAHGQDQEMKTRIVLFEERHAMAIRSLFPEGKDQERLLKTVHRYAEELHRILIGMSYLGDAPPRAVDAVASFGERLLAEILAAYMNRDDLQARALNAQKLIVTDDQYGAASPLWELTAKRCKRRILPLVQEGIIPVITGFIGATKRGVPTTLGRGGSDYSAALIGAALRVKEIWIYTDVDGVMTSDPKVVPASRSLDELSYHEVAELAYFGAKVIHPKTVFPAIAQRIPIRIKNTFNPDFPGTRVVYRTSPMNHVVKAISAIGHLSLVTVEGAGMLGVPEMTARIFDTIARENINVLLITQASSQQSICFVVRQADAAVVRRALSDEFARDLRRGDLQRIGVQDGVAIIAVVGEGMRGTPGVAGRLCAALGREGINIIAIAQGSSERNISLVVNDKEKAAAMRSIHKEFIG
jgi:aspartate kinase